MRYRLTTRGRIVVVVFAILLVVSGVSMLSKLQSGNHLASNSMADHQGNVEKSGSKDSAELDATQVPLETSEAEVDDVALENESPAESQENAEKSSVLNEASVRVFFKPDKYELSDNELAKLERVVEASKLYPENQLIIEGNINGYPQYDDTDFGRNLSNKRAEVVKTYLIEKGIDEVQIEVQSLGSQKPIENTSNLTDCWKNRRTDIYFKDYNGLTY